MLTELSAAQMASYRENGFLAVERLLDDDELECWRDAVDEAAAERGDTRIPGYQGEFDPSIFPNNDEGSQARRDYYVNVFRQRVNLWRSNSRLRDIILDSRLGRLAAQLAGVERIRVWHDQALIKEPYGNPTGFHLPATVDTGGSRACS